MNTITVHKKAHRIDLLSESFFKLKKSLYRIFAINNIIYVVTMKKSCGLTDVSPKEPINPNNPLFIIVRHNNMYGSLLLMKNSMDNADSIDNMTISISIKYDKW